jgi:hypothetical protein
MKLSEFLTLKAIASFIFGLGALFAPVYLVALHGAVLDAVGVVLTRYCGAVVFGIGLICWSLRNAPPSDARQGILLALFLTDAASFLVALLAQLAGVMNMAGWLDVAVWLLLAVGLGYFRFLKPSAA